MDAPCSVIDCGHDGAHMSDSEPNYEFDPEIKKELAKLPQGALILEAMKLIEQAWEAHQPERTAFLQYLNQNLWRTG